MKGDNTLNSHQAVQLIVQRNITKLFKSLLDVVDDIKQQNSSMLLKVSRETNTKYIQSINYLTPEMMDHIRKKVLDLGNESIREISSTLDCFELKVDEKKLENLLRNRNNKKSKTIRIVGGGHWVEEDDEK
jgi:hypothetical protein